MTQSPQPGEILTSESVKLLKAGDVLRDSTGAVVVFNSVDGPLIEVTHDRRTYAAMATRFTFIGRPDPEGWMPHDGGPNPVPGCRVELRLRFGTETGVLSADMRDWSHDGGDADIIAFRLAAPSVERDLGSLPATPSVPTCDAADVAAYLHPRLFSADIDISRQAASPYAVQYARQKAVADVQEVLNAARATTAAEPGTVGMEREARNEAKSPEPDVAGARERPDWMRPDFRYPEPSPEHKAAMEELLDKISYVDFTAMMQAKDAEIDRLRACVEADGEALRVLRDQFDLLVRLSSGTRVYEVDRDTRKRTRRKLSEVVAFEANAGSKAARARLAACKEQN